MNQHLPHQRPRVTEEPVTPQRVQRAARNFGKAVRELNASTRYVHDQIREHMGVPE